MTPIVLVPLDGSAAARSALPVAKGVARAIGGSVQVVYVTAIAIPPEEADRRLHAPAEVVRTAAGDPARAILAAAAPGAWIVLTRHCGHPRPDTGLGSVAEAVLAEAIVPVVLVPPTRGDVPWAPITALLPLDGTPASAEALPYAERLGADLRLLHVARPAHAPEPGVFTAPRYTDQPQHEWGAWREEFAVRAGCPGPPACPARVDVAGGEPEAAVLAAAREADLVVVAWHGSLARGRAPTLRALLCGAPCPVLVVRVRGPT